MFTILRDTHGTLSLRLGEKAIPVNDPYLEQLLREKGIHLVLGGTARVDDDVASAAIEEALASVGFELDGIQARKQQLLFSWSQATSATESSWKVAS